MIRRVSFTEGLAASSGFSLQGRAANARAIAPIFDAVAPDKPAATRRRPASMGALTSGLQQPAASELPPSVNKVLVAAPRPTAWAMPDYLACALSWTPTALFAVSFGLDTVGYFLPLEALVISAFIGTVAYASMDIARRVYKLATRPAKDSVANGSPASPAAWVRSIKVVADSALLAGSVLALMGADPVAQMALFGVCGALYLGVELLKTCDDVRLRTWRHNNPDALPALRDARRATPQHALMRAAKVAAGSLFALAAGLDLAAALTPMSGSVVIASYALLGAAMLLVGVAIGLKMQVDQAVCNALAAT